MWKIKTKFILSAISWLVVAISTWIVINFYTWNQPIPWWSIRVWWIFFFWSIIVWCIDTPAEKLFDSLTHKESEKLRKQKDIEYKKLELEEITIEEKLAKKRNNITALSNQQSNVSN